MTPRTAAEHQAQSHGQPELENSGKLPHCTDKEAEAHISEGLVPSCPVKQGWGGTSLYLKALSPQDRTHKKSQPQILVR